MQKSSKSLPSGVDVVTPDELRSLLAAFPPEFDKEIGKVWE